MQLQWDNMHTRIKHSFDLTFLQHLYPPLIAFKIKFNLWKLLFKSFCLVFKIKITHRNHRQSALLLDFLGWTYGPIEPLTNPGPLIIWRTFWVKYSRTINLFEMLLHSQSSAVHMALLISNMVLEHFIKFFQIIDGFK